VALGGVILMAVFFRLFAVVRFETGDDFMIAGIPAGVSGARDFHTIYVNDLLGRLFMGLNTILPNVSWYGLFQYALIIASMTALSWLLLKQKNAFSLILLTGLLAYFGYEYMVKVQYTKTGALAGIAGLFLLVDAIEKEKLSKKELVAGIILFTLGSFYRFVMFLGALGVLAVFGVSRAIIAFRSNRAAFKRYLLIIPAVFGISFLLYGLHNLNYRSPEWKEYRTFLDDERELNDYGYPSYQKNEKVYESVDVNENALLVYGRLDISDPEKYTDDVVNTISEAKKPKKITPKRIGEFFTEVVFSWFTNYPYVYAAFAAVVILLILKKRPDLILLLTLAVVFVFQFVLYIRGRVGFNRVDTGIFLALFMTAAYCAGLVKAKPPAAGDIETEKPSVTKKSLLLSCGVSAGMVVLCVLLYKNLTPYQNSIDIEPEMLAEKEQKLTLYEHMEQDETTLYLCSNSAYDYIGLFTPTDAILPESVVNTVRMGSWLTYSPMEYSLWERNGIENPYRTLADRDDVLLMTYDVYVQSMADYLNDYYNPDAASSPYEAALIKDIAGKKFFKIAKDLHEAPFDPAGYEDTANRLESVYNVTEENDRLHVSGSAFVEGESSFSGRYTLVLSNGKEMKRYFCVQSENPYAGDDLHGQYSQFDGDVPLEALKSGGHLYLVYENGDEILSEEIQTILVQ
jgi:hypothetical protein